MADSIAVDHVDTTAGYVLLASGEICEITNMFDDSGFELDEVDLAEGDEVASAVIQLRDGRWASIWPENVQKNTIH